MSGRDMGRQLSAIWLLNEDTANLFLVSLTNLNQIQRSHVVGPLVLWECLLPYDLNSSPI